MKEIKRLDEDDVLQGCPFCETKAEKQTHGSFGGYNIASIYCTGCNVNLYIYHTRMRTKKVEEWLNKRKMERKMICKINNISIAALILVIGFYLFSDLFFL